MKTLTLSLKKQWFDKIKSGEKKEEYRECSEYWITRFSKLCGFFEYKLVDHHRKMISCDRLKCDRLVFTLGYPKAGDTERRLCFKNPRIRIGTGRPEWGAEPGKQYFVITWEEATASLWNTMRTRAIDRSSPTTAGSSGGAKTRHRRSCKPLLYE